MIFVLLVFVFLSCNKEEQEQEMIDAALELKKQLYRKEAMAKCREEMMLTADALADSILLVRINVRNPIERPERPPRPETPEINFEDTLKLVKPGGNKRKKSDLQDTAVQGSNFRKTE